MATFVRIVDCGSLSGASEALDTSLSSVVRTLARLEASLGVRLLNRTTRRIALTEEGRHFLERCRRILADVEDAERALSAHQQEPAGVLRVSAPVLFGQRHVAPAVSGFLARHRRMQVDLLLLDRVVNLVEEGIDVAVRIGRPSDSSLVAVRVGELRRMVVASSALLEAHGRPEHPRDLENLPCVRFTGLMPGATWHFVERGRPLAVRVGGQLACNQAAACVDACVDGLGFGMFISYQVRRQTQGKRLEEVLTNFAPAPLPVSLVFPHARLLSSRVRAFVDFAAVELRRTLGGFDSQESSRNTGRG
jgi:DNA-binding transcriptional LysR family regulator